MKIERRFTLSSPSIRTGGSTGGTARQVSGYAALFNSRSQDLGGFYEVIQPGAFDAVLNDNCVALFNHDNNLILARSRNGRGTLKIGTDSKGLWYRFDAPKTQAGNDLLVSLERGDVSESSFGFIIAEDRWGKVNGMPLRTITKLARLLDISPVVSAAYTATSVQLDTLPGARSEPLDLAERRLRLLKARAGAYRL
jgi:uncharacterized protein